MFRTGLRSLLNVEVYSTARRQQPPPPFCVAVTSGVYRECSGRTPKSEDAKTSSHHDAHPAVKTWFDDKDRSISATYRPQPWDFDHTGAVPIWKFLQQTSFQWMDMYPHWFTPPENGPPFTDLFITRCMYIDFSRSFHNQIFPGCSLPYTLRICKVGKTSIVLNQKILDINGKDVIAEDHKHCISVSSKTRRPLPWAAWLPQRYPDLCSAPPVSTVEPFGSIPAEPSFVHTVKVAPSDTDNYRHVGWFQYVRYCCDCASFGAEQGAYAAITGDTVQCRVKRAEALYQGEARACDVLTVASWEDPQQPDLIKFQIKKGEDNITQCSLQFFTTLQTSAKPQRLKLN